MTKKCTCHHSHFIKKNVFLEDENTEILEKNHDIESKDSLEEIEPSECKIPKTEIEEPPVEHVEVKVIYNKNKYDVKANMDSTVADFKKELQQLLGNETALLYQRNVHIMNFVCRCSGFNAKTHVQRYVTRQHDFEGCRCLQRYQDNVSGLHSE